MNQENCNSCNRGTMSTWVVVIVTTIVVTIVCYSVFLLWKNKNIDTTSTTTTTTAQVASPEVTNTTQSATTTEETILEPGEYQVLKQNRSEILLLKKENPGEFPNWKRLIPDLNAFPWSEGKSTEFSYVDKKKSKNASFNMFKLAKIMPDNCAVNYEYLSDMAMLDTGKMYTAKEDAGVNPVYFETKTGHYGLIMPMRG